MMGLASFLPGISLDVKIAITPSLVSTSDKSRVSIFPCAISERPSATDKVPFGISLSSMN